MKANHDRVGVGVFNSDGPRARERVSSVNKQTNVRGPSEFVYLSVGKLDTGTTRKLKP